jgi:hypothetical protein
MGADMNTEQILLDAVFGPRLRDAVREAVATGDAEWLGRLAPYYLGYEVDAKKLMLVLRLAAADEQIRWAAPPLIRDCRRPGAGGDKLELVKEVNYENFLRRGGSAGDPEDGVAGVFHLGFAFVEETEEHLRRLRSGPDRRWESETARSKIGDTNLVVRPIDQTAGMVAKTEKPKEAT